MKTICIFSGYQLPHLGGIERYTDNLTKQLIKNNYKVIIVSSNYKFNETYYIKDGNIEKYLIPVYKIFRGRYPIPKHSKVFKEIMGKLENEDIETIIVNTRFHLTSLVGSRFGKKKGIPVYLIEHGSQHLTVDNRILDFLGQIYEHCLTKIVKKYINYNYGVSKEACKWQKHFGIESDGVWYNSINDFSKRRKISKEEDKFVFLYAGRLLKQKGLSELCHAFSKLNEEYSNIELRIAGEGPYKKELKRKYKNENIIYLGKLDFDELCHEYSKAKVFVYAPNWPEGLPTGILEAGLMECSVISSPQGGNKEIVIDNETGLMVENKKQLYEAMKLLYDNKKLRVSLSNNLKEKILSEFVWEETGKRIISDINENNEKFYKKNKKC